MQFHATFPVVTVRKLRDCGKIINGSRVFHEHTVLTKMTILVSQALLHEKKIQQQNVTSLSIELLSH